MAEEKSEEKGEWVDIRWQLLAGSFLKLTADF